MTTHGRIADLTLQLSGRLRGSVLAHAAATESTVRHTIVALALAVALSGAAANVAAARGGGGGGHGGGFGHMGGGIGSDFVAGGGFGGAMWAGSEEAPWRLWELAPSVGLRVAISPATVAMWAGSAALTATSAILP